MVQYQDIKMPEELYFYMQNFEYGYLTRDNKIIKEDKPNCNDYWHDNYMLQTTEDLIKTQTGNCFDQAEFARNWLESHDYQVKTYYEYVNDNLKFSHSFVVYNDKRYGSKWNWLETTWKRCEGIHCSDDLSELLKLNYELYSKELLRNTISYDNIKMVEFDIPKDHSTLEEYLDNIKRGKVLVLKDR